MQKSRNQIFKTLNISLIFLALGVLVAIFLGSFLISCANPKPTPTPPTPTQTTKITGYNGTTDDVIFDSNNNLYFINYDNNKNNKNIYKVEHDTTNAIKLISRKDIGNHVIFAIQLDKNNNLYILIIDPFKPKNFYKVEHDTTNAVEIKINGISNENISQIWFDKDNNLFIDYDINNIYTFYKVEHDTTNAVEITGINGPLKKFKFDSENNLWIQSGNNNIKFYEIKNNTINAVEIKITGITDYKNFKWIIDNKDNLYFIKQSDTTLPFGTLYRINKNTINPIEITGYLKDKANINSLFLNKDNLYFYDKEDNFYQINNNSVNAVKITGYKGNFINIIIDNENNLWINDLISIYKVEHDTTNAIKINNTSNVNNLDTDKNNNLYFLSNRKIYKIKNNTTISKQIEIPEYKEKLISFYFDKSNNLYFIGNDNKQIYKTTNFIK